MSRYLLFPYTIDNANARIVKAIATLAIGVEIAFKEQAWSYYSTALASIKKTGAHVSSEVSTNRYEIHF